MFLPIFAQSPLLFTHSRLASKHSLSLSILQLATSNVNGNRKLVFCSTALNMNPLYSMVSNNNQIGCRLSLLVQSKCCLMFHFTFVEPLSNFNKLLILGHFFLSHSSLFFVFERFFLLPRFYTSFCFIIWIGNTRKSSDIKVTLENCDHFQLHTVIFAHM